MEKENNDFLLHERMYRKEISNRDAKILLCGCGALGSWLAEFLSRQGYTNITVLDFDRVEQSNFGTQNFCKSDIGRMKAQQLANNIFIKIGTKITPIIKRLTNENTHLLKNYNLIVDLFDNIESRRLVQNAANTYGIECLHAGVSSIGFLDICWNDNYKLPTDNTDRGEDVCEYPLASNLVFLCVSLSAEVINKFIDNGKKQNLQFWLNSFSVEKSFVC